MTRTHAARGLLKQGPLTFADFVAITGWPYKVCRRVISYLQEHGEAFFIDGEWRLA